MRSISFLLRKMLFRGYAWTAAIKSRSSSLCRRERVRWEGEPLNRVCRPKIARNHFPTGRNDADLLPVPFRR